MSVDRGFYIYVIFRPTGAPCYVGLGKGDRWKKHFRSKTNIHLNRIIKKFAGAVPVVKMREGLTFKEAAAIEVALIAAIGRETNGGPLVNLTDGGEGVAGLIHSEQSRKQMSLAKKGRPGKKLNAESRARISEKNTGRERTPEALAKMSTAHKRRGAAINSKLRGLITEAMRTPETRERCRQSALGRVHSAETRAKMSQAHKGKTKSAATRARMCLAAQARVAAKFAAATFT
jgi:hypothetical protein